MGLRTFKFGLISGLALSILTIAGCGGGSSSGTGPTNSIFTQGSTNCAAVLGPQPINSTFAAVMGSCDQFEASSVPTRSLTAFKNPGFSFPVVFNQSTGYNITLPLLTPGTTNLPLSSKLTLPAETVATSFGNFAGSTYRTVFDSISGGSAFIYDYRNAVTDAGQKYLDLNYSRFGLFSRFDNRTLGYYGGWFQGDNQGNIPASSALFKGLLVGNLGPSAGGTASATTVGYSANIEIQVNFATPTAPITSLSLSNFAFTFDGKKISTQEVSPGGAVSVSSLDVVSKTISASFTSGAAGAASSIIEGGIAGAFSGASSSNVTEFVGTIKFRTQDGRNAIGAFGTRVPVNNSILNP